MNAILTPQQLDDARKYNNANLDVLEMDHPRELAVLVAVYQARHGLPVDGKLGPKTLASVRTYLPEPAPAPAPPRWPAFDGPLTRRPLTLEDVNRAYGDPTRGGLYAKVEDPVWRKAHLTTFEPGTLPLVRPTGPGRYVTVNEAVAPYLVEGLRRARDVVPAGTLYRIGGFNFRHMRHDPKMPLSRHAWGAAVDVDAENNAAKSFPAGRTPEPWSAEWQAQWPEGLSRDFVEAMESVGFRWGGRWRGFCDPQHFELCGGDDVAL